MTSSDTVISYRKKWKIPKMGHTGTLDRFAEGLLILPFGDYTSFSQFFLEKDKTYYAEVHWGRSTDSGDLDGKTLVEWSEEEHKKFQESWPTWQPSVFRSLEALTHRKTQEAPLVSALKSQGKRFSDLYRAGDTPVPRTRNIRIPWVKDLGWNSSGFSFRIRVSSGTYIRKIVTDLSEELSLPLVLVKLVRESIGDWTLSDLRSWQELPPWEAKPWKEVLPFPQIILTEREAELVTHGGFISRQRLPQSFPEGCLFLDPSGEQILAWSVPYSSAKNSYRYAKVFFNPSLKNAVFK